MSSRAKKVHYERGTKGGSSRDSGFGSASDRASLGTGVDDAPSSYQQRHDVQALQEALDAAYDTIKQLESANQKLCSFLSDSNKENRQLKKEKGTLLDQVEELLVDLKEERKANKKLSRETSPRTATRTSPPRVEAPRLHSGGPRGGRRASVVCDLPPLAPQPPPPNPFAPLDTRLPLPVTYPPSPTLLHAPTTKPYAAGSMYAPTSPISPRSHSGSVTSSKSKDDGRYHLTPL